MSADYVFKSRAIFDSVRNETFEGAIVITGNHITSIIPAPAKVPDESIGENTRVVDCGDNLITAGMIDSHMHFFDGIFQNSRFMCRELFACKSAAECVEVIDAFAKQHPDYRTITGMGWFMPQWDDQTPPDKDMLDKICPDRPVYLMCADGHSFWMNTKALEESEIDPDRKLLFGEIEKNEKGEANGVLHEMDACACCSVNAQRLPDGHQEELITDFVRNLASMGITSTTDMTVLPQPMPITDDMKAIDRLNREGRFDLRLNLYPPLGTTDDFTIVNEYRERFASDKYRVAGLKAFVDGVHGNHTALLMEPYVDAPDCIGESFYSYEHYMRQIKAANDAGYGVKLHCCGEGAVHWALDAFEGACPQDGRPKVRNSIEHAETIREEDFERFAKYKVTAAMQPLHLMYEGKLLQDILGPERSKYEQALRTMITMGINVAFSSDFPVAEFDPRVNIYFSMTRCDRDGNPIEDHPTESISLADAIKAYTIGGAYCLNMEDRLGTLEEGKLADLVVWDSNLFELEPKDILEANIDLTMVDGKVSYEAQ